MQVHPLVMGPLEEARVEAWEVCTQLPEQAEQDRWIMYALEAHNNANAYGNRHEQRGTDPELAQLGWGAVDRLSMARSHQIDMLALSVRGAVHATLQLLKNQEAGDTGRN